MPFPAPARRPSRRRIPACAFSFSFSVRDSPFFAQLARDVENARIAFSRTFFRDCDSSRLFSSPSWWLRRLLVPTDACPLLSSPADGKGSRLLTANEHWKSQIRHALYTSPRFKRVDDGEAWSVSNPEAKAPEPVTVGKRPPCPSLSLSLSL